MPGSAVPSAPATPSPLSPRLEMEGLPSRERSAREIQRAMASVERSRGVASPCPVALPGAQFQFLRHPTLPSTLSIRAATPADVKRLTPLFVAYRRFYKLVPRARLAAAFLTERLTRGEAIVYIARVGERGTAGFALVYPTFSSLRLAPAWTLNDLFVAPRYRRLGVARALLQEVARQARARGVAVVSLATAQTNARAKALYEAEDYVEDIGFAHYDLTVPQRGARSGR